MTRRPAHVDLLDWIMMRRSIDERGCWNWTGAKIKRGYGMVRVPGGPVRLVHRIVYSRMVAPIADDDCVLHHCDNPSCFRPDHLFVGDRAVNNADRDAKGRNVAHSGERHGMSRLTDADVRRIRSDPRPATHLARELGVYSSTVDAVRNGKTWRHVT